MVAARSRILAFWISALMLVTIVPVTAPTAVATHANLVSSKLYVIEGGTPIEYVPGTFLGAGTQIRVDWTVDSESEACSGVGVNPVVTLAGATVNAVILGLTASEAATLSDPVPASAGQKNITLTKTIANSAQFLPGATLNATATYSCSTTPSATTHTQVHESARFSLDTIPPSLSSTVTPEHAPSREALTPPGGVDAVGAVGTVLTFSLASNGTSLLWDPSGVDPTATAGYVPVPSNTPSIEIKAFGNGWSAIDGQPKTVKFRAVDGPGNTRDTTLTVHVDNVRPNSAAAPTTGASLVRSQVREAFAGEDQQNIVKIPWTGASNISRAKITIRDTNAGGAILATGYGTSAGGEVRFNVNPTGSENLDKPLHFTLTPVDAAGNGPADAASLSRFVWFPNMTTRYGVGQTSPETLSNISNVIIDTNGGPTTPWTFGEEDQDPGILWAELARKAGSNTLEYFQVGTENSFGPSIPQPSEEGSTAIRPSGTLTAPHTGIVLSHLASTTVAGTRFEDGSYYLYVNLNGGGGATGNKLQHVLRFKIDGNPPEFSQPEPYADNGTDTAPTFRQVHGMDGNPFWVAAYAHDQEGDEETGLFTDSGIRNVTFELIDASTKQVVRRASVADANAANALARVDLKPGSPLTTSSCLVDDDITSVQLPYCLDLGMYAPDTGECTGDPTLRTLWCQYLLNLANEEVPDEEKYNTTVIDPHFFRGWVNTTFGDLPVGRYQVRVVANDHAGAKVSKVFPATGSDRYVVAPAVKVFTNATTPSLDAEGDLNVIALASEYSLNLDNNLICNPSAPAGLCAVENVEIQVSTTPSGAGITLEPTLRGAAAQWLSDTDLLRGYSTSTMLPNGTMFESNSIVPVSFYRYTGEISAATLAAAGIPAGSSLFVRAVALSKDSTGAVVSRTTDWIPVSRPGDDALTINAPPVTGAYNLSTEGKNPYYNITYDGKNKPTPPVMQIWINKSHPDTGLFTVPVSNHDSMAPERLSGAAVQYVANWSGHLPGAALAAGIYKLDVQMFENRTTESGVVRDVLVTKSRQFIVLAEKPKFELGTPTASSNLAPTNDPVRFYSKSTFTLPYTIQHGDIPQPTPGQLNFTLKPSTGAEATVYPGQFGFNVVASPAGIVPGGTKYNLQVTLPLDAQHAGIYTLITRLDIGAAANVGNPTHTTTFVLDKVAPYGALLPLDTENTVMVRAPDPTKTAIELEAPFPTLIGYAKDNQSGVATVEVRIVDLTAGHTIRLDQETHTAAVADTTKPDGYTPVAGIFGDAWASSSTFTLGGLTRQFVYVSAPSTDGTVTWHLPLNRTTATGLDPKFWRPSDMANASGWIDASHTYRIDVRARDKLGALSDSYSTIFDFDGAAPFLGHSNRLNMSAEVPSGIVASKTRVNWRAVDDSVVLTTHVTDNNCLKAVRLVGNTSKTQTPVWANMTAIEFVNADGSKTPIPAGTTPICARGKQVNYQLNLNAAPQLANDIGQYTYWIEAEDTAGQVSSTPANIRFFHMEVLDKTPASVRQAIIDPNPGQSGGRALIRANVFDNNNISHVTIELRNDTTGAVIANGTMRPDNVTPFGIGWWIADTTDDMNATLLTGNYRFNITAFDVFWNRSVDDGGPTCTPYCFGLQPLYTVRDDGAPSVQLVSPSDGSSVGTSPTITMRAQHKAITASQIVVRMSTDGTEANLTAVPASELNVTELLASNGSRQGWTVVYKPTNLSDNQTLLVNFSASIPGLTAAASYTFRVDASAPTVNATASNLVTLAGKEWGTRLTRIAISATDATGGAAPSILYTVNGGAQQTYGAEIDPTGDGEWRLEYWATDASGNSAVHKTLNFTLDERGPNVSRIPVSDPDEVLLNVVDTGVGLNESTVTVHYRYATTGAFTPQKAEKVSGNSFRATLPGQANETGLQYYVTASDLLGNEGTNGTQSQPHTIDREGGGTEDNLPPTISITAPLPDAVVNGSVTIRWLASDPEQGTLTVSIAIKSPNPRVLVTAGENTGSYVLNLAGAPGGQYTVVVSVNDGKESVNAEVTFTVQGEIITVPTPPPTNVTPNTPVTVAVRIAPLGKTIEAATFRVLKDGIPYLNGTLAAVQGQYVAQFTPTEPGAYTMFADVRYADDTSEPPKQIAAFTVSATTPPPGGDEAAIVPTSIISLGALAVLTIAAAAYGAFGRWKK